MSRATWKARDEFTRKLLAAVPTATEAHARKLLRWGATYARLSEAECNGDWPAENGEGKRYECPKCQSGWRIRSALRECPSCRAERIIRETCESVGGPQNAGYYGFRDVWYIVAEFQGDPRGHTVRLQIAGQPRDGYDRAALSVPTS